MTMAALKDLHEALEQSGATELADMAERVSHELAEAYAALACVANIRAEQRLNPGVWEAAYADVIARAKRDHSTVIA